MTANWLIWALLVWLICAYGFSAWHIWKLYGRFQRFQIAVIMRTDAQQSMIKDIQIFTSLFEKGYGNLCDSFRDLERQVNELKNSMEANVSWMIEYDNAIAKLHEMLGDKSEESALLAVESEAQND